MKIMKGVLELANHKSALKRAKQSIIRRDRNRAVKSGVKTLVKKVRTDVAEGTAEAAVTDLKLAMSLIDKAAKKGVIHRNTAARKISRLNKLVNTLSA